MATERIEIVGPIGAGKSSLASLLADTDYKVVFENFASNPFWQVYYTNPSKYNLETEITFLLQHYHEVKRHSEESNRIACDFSFLQDYAYADVDLDNRQLELFKSLYNHILDDVGAPDLVIHVDCPVDTLLSRIVERGRAEEKFIEKSFLEDLSASISNQLSSNAHYKNIPQNIY